MKNISNNKDKTYKINTITKFPKENPRITIKFDTISLLNY